MKCRCLGQPVTVTPGSEVCAASLFKDNCLGTQPQRWLDPGTAGNPKRLNPTISRWRTDLVRHTIKWPRHYPPWSCISRFVIGQDERIFRWKCSEAAYKIIPAVIPILYAVEIQTGAQSWIWAFYLVWTFYILYTSPCSWDCLPGIGKQLWQALILILVIAGFGYRVP